MSLEDHSGSVGLPWVADPPGVAYPGTTWDTNAPRHRCCPFSDVFDWEDEETARTESGDADLNLLCGPFGGVIGYEASNIEILASDVRHYHWNGTSYDDIGGGTEGYSFHDSVRVRFFVTLTGDRPWKTSDGEGVRVRYTTKTRVATKIAATPPGSYMGDTLTGYPTWSYADTASGELESIITVPPGTAGGTTVDGPWITFAPGTNTLTGFDFSDPSVEYTNECIGDA